ncbi:hypothetical protein RRF57_006324 [Xylaria bambusicola]|uniref:Epoxide hydrolase N-terminal domain-containing protein n=1 Tax=Xylaria bambusicola TaxID=326684 RepID=A0AAN7UNK8_9PEZI
MPPSSISPFKITVPGSDLAHLKERLLRTIYQDELHNAGGERGVPLADIKQVANYWATIFNWRKAAAMLNRFLQYTTDIVADGLIP